MSSLRSTEKRYLEELLGMSSGYVGEFTDATFAELFNSYGIDIHSEEYQKYGTSKAKKLRAFWDAEADGLVGDVLSELLETYEADCALGKKSLNSAVLAAAREIVTRLHSEKPPSVKQRPLEKFLEQEFDTPNIDRLPIPKPVADIVKARIEEAKLALDVNAGLSVILLCGSVLEAVLLGKAQSDPATFNGAALSPKAKDGKVKRFHEWSLVQFIDVATEVGVLKPDIKKFSHGLRDFRNYIHPYEQLNSGFTPDLYTAKVCFQVLKAALASVSGDR